MTENNKNLIENLDQRGDQPDAPPLPRAKKSSFKWLLWLTLGLLLIVAGVGGYGGYLGWTYWLKLQESLALQSQQIQQAQTLVNELKAQNQNSAQQSAQLIAQQNQRIEILQSELIATARRFTESHGVTRYEWLLAEAEYLMRLAQQRLSIEKDPQGALTILQSADAVLKDSNDAGLIDVRSALADEMASLAAVQSVDQIGVYLKIASLVKQLDELKWNEMTPVRESVSESEDESLSWLKRFENVFRIRTLDDDFVMPPGLEQQQVIEDVLRLKLEQAQGAVIRSETEMFQASLEQAIAWLTRYANHLNQSQYIIEQLEGLKDQQLAPVLPEIGQSLALLKGYIAQIYRLQRQAPDVESTQ